MTIQSEQPFSGAKLNNMSRNNWKQLFEVNFSKNCTETIRNNNMHGQHNTNYCVWLIKSI